ncbi:hypothetical protein C4J94_2445 [Pseudomonas sp. R5-89-07]|nr:hypothetical protein C4J94_2445 [Pseudomonas sp. R5-89-07]
MQVLIRATACPTVYVKAGEVFALFGVPTQEQGALIS